jgi:hypothetical protein
MSLRVLAQVTQDFADYFLVMQVDSILHNSSSDFNIPENLRLITQPPRSPQLNLTEDVWEEISEKHFYNRAFETLDAVWDNLCQGLKELIDLA